MQVSALQENSVEDAGRFPSRSEASCLLISGSKSRLKTLVSGANAAEWVAVGCERIADSLRLQLRQHARLVLVDLAGAGDSERTCLERVAERVARSGGLLVVFGTPEGDDTIEIQARQLGAWMYLAGDLSVDGVAELCREASELLDRLDSPTGRLIDGRSSHAVDRFLDMACV